MHVLTRYYNQGHECASFEALMDLYREHHCSSGEHENAFAAELIELVDSLCPCARDAVIYAWMAYMTSMANTTFGSSVLADIYNAGIYHIDLVYWNIDMDLTPLPFNRSKNSIYYNYGFLSLEEAEAREKAEQRQSED